MKIGQKQIKILFLMLANNSALTVFPFGLHLHTGLLLRSPPTFRKEFSLNTDDSLSFSVLHLIILHFLDHINLPGDFISPTSPWPEDVWMTRNFHSLQPCPPSLLLKNSLLPQLKPIQPNHWTAQGRYQWKTGGYQGQGWQLAAPIRTAGHPRKNGALQGFQGQCPVPPWVRVHS